MRSAWCGAEAVPGTPRFIKRDGCMAIPNPVQGAWELGAAKHASAARCPGRMQTHVAPRFHRNGCIVNNTAKTKGHLSAAVKAAPPGGQCRWGFTRCLGLGASGGIVQAHRCSIRLCLCNTNSPGSLWPDIKTCCTPHWADELVDCLCFAALSAVGSEPALALSTSLTGICVWNARLQGPGWDESLHSLPCCMHAIIVLEVVSIHTSSKKATSICSAARCCPGAGSKLGF